MGLKRQIGLVGGIAIVVGGVIGMGAFVLIPLICSKAGGAAWLAISIALVTSLVSVFPIIQLSSAYPVAGAGYEYGNKFISPIAGILFSWWSLVGGASAVGLVAYGLVESFKIYLPEGFSLHIAALLLVMGFYIIFLAGTKFLTALQIVLTIQKLLAILVFTIPVLFMCSGKTSFTLPQSNTFYLAIIVSFNISLGFQIIMELGEEIKQPEKNIPLSLIIGAAIILVVYLMIAAAYSGMVGETNLPNKPDLVITASHFLPAWAIVFMRIGIFGAALTSFIGGAMALPRELFAQSRANILPPFLSKINERGNPQNAISLFFVFICIVLLIGEVLERLGILTWFFEKDIIEFYGFLTIMGIMLLTIGISIAAWRLPRLAPQNYEGAYIRFSKPWLSVFVVVALLSSLFLIVLVCTKWIIPVAYLIVTAIVLVIFRKYFQPQTRIK